jgi:hypothetical protein
MPARSCLRRVLISLVIAAVLMAIHPRPVRANPNLSLEMAKMAEGLKKLLTSRGEDAIAVGQFTGPAASAASAGPAIVKALSEELQKAGVTVKRRANLEVKGEYVDVTDKQSGKLAALIRARVLDRAGTVVVEMERGVFGEAALSSLFGLTADLPPGEDELVRDKRLKDSIDKPKVSVDNTRIAAGKGSPYAIEILVNGEARTVKEEDGQAFVSIKRGEAYQIRVVNDSPLEAGVTITIDGINLFAFSEMKDAETGKPKYTCLIVDPKTNGDIKGWHRTNQVSDSFLITEYAKSAAAELQNTANVGTITVTFCAAWPKDQPPPADEPAEAKAGTRSVDATGRGPQIAAKFEEVSRNFGVIRATVSVRYSKEGR